MTPINKKKHQPLTVNGSRLLQQEKNYCFAIEGIGRNIRRIFVLKFFSSDLSISVN